jgi:hypothetical protein
MKFMLSRWRDDEILQVAIVKETPKQIKYIRR